MGSFWPTRCVQVRSQMGQSGEKKRVRKRSRSGDRFWSDLELILGSFRDNLWMSFDDFLIDLGAILTDLYGVFTDFGAILSIQRDFS